MPQSHLLTKSLIHLFSGSLHTLPPPQAIYYSSCFLPSRPAWRLPGACDFHASTHIHPNVCACTYTRTQQWSYPEGPGAGVLPHTTPTHHVYTHTHLCIHTPMLPPHMGTGTHRLCTHAYPQEPMQTRPPFIPPSHPQPGRPPCCVGYMQAHMWSVTMG